MALLCLAAGFAAGWYLRPQPVAAALDTDWLFRNLQIVTDNQRKSDALLRWMWEHRHER